MQNNPAPDGIESFIDELIAQKGYPEMSPEAREEMRRDLRRRIDDFIMARVVAALTDEQLIGFEKLLAEKKPRAELQKYAAENIPDFVSFLTNALIEFQAVYLASSPGMKT